jgi:dynein heavy chain, axonemal
MRIMDCVLILKKLRLELISIDPERNCVKPSWNESLKLMSNTYFLQSLVEFKKDLINEEQIELLEPYFRQKDYELETARRVSGNVAGLLIWTTAMTNFFSINKEVLPIKANLATQELRYNSALDDLRRAEDQLLQKNNEFNLIMDEYNQAMSQKQILLDDAAYTQNKLSSASSLIHGLFDERLRWTQQSKDFKNQIRK